MTAFLQDVRSALRMFRHSPGFALVAVATLALGIGANTAIFSVVHAVLLRRLPFPDSGRLAMVWEAAPDGRNDHNVVNPGNFIRWRERSRSFASLAAATPWTANLSGSGAPLRVKVGYVSGEFFSTLGVALKRGRGILPSDATENAPDVVVISRDLWEGRFGGNPAIIGKDVRIDGSAARVVGVAESGFDLPPGTQVWVPMAFGARQREARGRYLAVIGRLKPGVTVRQAQAEMTTIAAALRRERPDVDGGWGASVVPLREQLVGGFRTGLLVLMGAVGALLLVACANLTNLLIARGAGRRRELAVRTALGASRARLVGMQLVESGVIAIVGGAAGVGLAFLGVRGILAVVPLDLPQFFSVNVNGAALAFTAAASIAVGLASGLVPLIAVRPASLRDALQGGAATVSRPQARFSGLLVASQVALSVVLLTGAGLLMRSLLALWGVDPGYRTERVVSFRIDLPSGRYAAPGAIPAFFGGAEDRLRRLPGVTDVGSVSWLPLGGPGAATGYFPSDGPVPEKGKEPDADIRVVTPGFFRTIGIPLVRGRVFGADDAAGAPLRAVVNEDLARRSFPGKDPLGARLSVAWGGSSGGPAFETVEIVGIVGNAHFDAVDKDPRPAIFFPQAQQPSNFMTVLLRGPSDPAALASPIRRIVAELDPELPVADLQTLDRVFADSLKRPRFFSSLLAVFSALSLFLASIGVYGVVSAATARRTREIGIRMALGGRPGDLFRNVLLRGMRPVLGGALAGIAGALAAGKAVRSLLFGIAPTDPATMIAVLVLLAAAALLACVVPARRAARLDPITALRQE